LKNALLQKKRPVWGSIGGFFQFFGAAKPCPLTAFIENGGSSLMLAGWAAM